MNYNIDKLFTYPFEKLKVLLSKIKLNDKTIINLSIGEPKHKIPKCVEYSINKNISKISLYPSTKGYKNLRKSISKWISNRYFIKNIEFEKQILPVSGSREAIFSFIQAFSNKKKYIIIPNPFYQIYEGASFLSDSIPYYIEYKKNGDFNFQWDRIPKNILKNTSIIFICSPGNPNGNIIHEKEWKFLFDLSNKYNFIIASDECYSEIYFNEKTPPKSAILYSINLNIKNFRNLVVFNSLSKRSNIPGIRSGFIFGDEKILSKFLIYRTYHGCAMNPMIQLASIYAWKDENHVLNNRILYRKKFNIFLKILNNHMKISKPEATFFLWINTNINDTKYSKYLYKKTGIKILPGSFLSRNLYGVNKGNNKIRLALIISISDCIKSAKFILNFQIKKL